MNTKRLRPLFLLAVIGLTYVARFFGGGSDAGRGDTAVAPPATPPSAAAAPIGYGEVRDVAVVDIRTGKTIVLGTVDLKPTLVRIAAGEKHPHRNDGSVFRNFGDKLPRKKAGYYREYVVPTPGISGPGPQRLVIGAEGEVYYTSDHYETFIRVKGGG